MALVQRSIPNWHMRRLCLGIGISPQFLVWGQWTVANTEQALGRCRQPVIEPTPQPRQD